MFKNTLKSKPKNTFLQFEEMDDNGIYAFTFNPIDQPKDGPLGVLEWFDQLKSFFFNMKYSKYRLYIEVSKTGRWHLHGFINIKNRLRFCIKDVPQLIIFGTTCIKIIKTTDDYANWLAYCNKQQNEMNDLLTSELYCMIDPKVISQRNPDGVITISNI